LLQPTSVPEGRRWGGRAEQDEALIDEQTLSFPHSDFLKLFWKIFVLLA